MEPSQLDPEGIRRLARYLSGEEKLRPDPVNAVLGAIEWLGNGAGQPRQSELALVRVLPIDSVKPAGLYLPASSINTEEFGSSERTNGNNCGLNTKMHAYERREKSFNRVRVVKQVRPGTITADPMKLYYCSKTIEETHTILRDGFINDCKYKGRGKVTT
jgi:hypothetical protein